MYLLIQPGGAHTGLGIAVLDADRLQQHGPARSQNALAGRKEFVPMLAANGLEHLDRHHLVERPLNVAVVRVHDPHLVIQPGGGNPLASQSDAARATP